MKIVISLFFLGTFLFGDIFDDYHLYQAQKYISTNKYQKALEHYEKVENKTATVHYNLGNLYYMQGEYQKAITSYKQVNEATLEFQTLHNLGNSYVKTNQIDKAMISYQKAIILKNDQATKTNFELLLRSQKKELEAKKRRTKGRETTQEKDGQKKSSKGGQEDFDDMDNRDNGEVSKQGRSVQRKNPKDPKNNLRTTTSALQEEQKIEPIGNNKGATTSSKQRKRLEMIAQNEEKKWVTIIEKRKLNTLLIPLNQKGVIDENIDNPW